MPGQAGVVRGPSGSVGRGGWDKVAGVGGSACAQKALGFSGVGGAPQGSIAPFQAMVPMFPPQGQALGSGLQDDVEAAPAHREVFRDDGRSDDQCLRELRDSQHWAERQENILCAQAPVFVPSPSRPINFMTTPAE